MKYALLLLAALFSVGLLKSQISKEMTEAMIEQKAAALSSPARVEYLYVHFNYRMLWLTDENDRQQLLQLLDNAGDLGLDSNDYQISFIRTFKNRPVAFLTTMDSIEADVFLSDAFLHFLNDASLGSHTPEMGYNGLNYVPDYKDIVKKLLMALQQNRIRELVSQLEPQIRQYRLVKNKLHELNEIMAGNSYKKDVLIVSNSLTDRNKPLLYKLYEFGFLSATDTSVAESMLTEKIKQAAGLFDLPPDGKLNAALIKALDTPLAARRASLSELLNTIRFVHGLLSQDKLVVVVNIPSATLLVFQRDSIILESKVMVGRTPTPTPTLGSRITEVVLYPYWNVPHKIAARELLPLIKRDRQYIDKNNLQVLNKNGKIVDPAGINWQQFNAGNFPYRLRQSTGCDNSLGLVKLNFYNPYTVYLHDTPWKMLFQFSRRYFSHGCMRLEKTTQLAQLAAPRQAAFIDSVINKGCLIDEQPLSIPATEKMPVLVLYHTAWVDSSGTVRFYEDIYKKNKGF